MYLWWDDQIRAEPAFDSDTAMIWAQMHSKAKNKSFSMSNKLKDETMCSFCRNIDNNIV